MSILEYRKNDGNNQTSKFSNFQKFHKIDKIRQKNINVKKCDKINGSLAFAGFCILEYGDKWSGNHIIITTPKYQKKFPHFHTAVLQYSKYPRYPKKSAIFTVFPVFAIFPCTREISSIHDIPKYVMIFSKIEILV